MNISEAAAIMGKKGGQSGTGESKRRDSKFYSRIARYGWGYRQKTVEERFWEKVKKGKPDECWLWMGNINKVNKYGQFHFNKRPHTAHRIAYMLTHGKIPDGLDVCHDCDVRQCCNPAHLYSGTRLDNMRDASVRKRFPDRRGEKAATSVLKDHQALEIRRDFVPYKVTRFHLADRYNVSVWAIDNVLSRKTFSHI